MTAFRQRLEQIFRGKRRSYPAAPAVMGLEDLQALKRQVQSLQEQLDIIIGRRGDVCDQHVTVCDLEMLGLLTAQEETSELLVYGAEIAGTGDVYADLNVMDFTGHAHADGTALEIKTNALVTFGHNLIAYLWKGPQGVTVGLGGSYTAADPDLVPVGTGDHAILSNRDQNDSHPQGAITNLTADQNIQNGRLTTLESRADATDIEQGVQDGRLDTLELHPPRVDNPHAVTHAQLPDKGSNTHTQIDTHIGDQLIHFSDVPVDGVGYVRRDRQWVTNINFAVLYGDPANGSLGTGGLILQNWSEHADFGAMLGTVDPVAGTIAIPADGVYRINVHIHGNQGNDNKEESIWLDIEVIGGPDAGWYEAAHESVDTDKTSSRTLSVSVVRRWGVGEVARVRLRASTGLGVFSFVLATFEMAKLV